MHMRRTLHTFLALVLSMPLLAGCWDRLDPENMAFIIAIGVDPGPKNDYLFTFALALPKPSMNASTSGGGSLTKKGITIFTVEGSNINSALLASQSFIARRLTLIHSKAFILGEEMARKGVMPILGEVVRNREFRRTFYVLTTRGKAENYIHDIMPTVESDISLWFELELDPNNAATTLPVHSRFHNFIMDMETPGTGAISILTSGRPDIKDGHVHLSTDHSSPDATQPNVGNQLAGKIRRKGEVPVEFFGSAVYKGSHLKGFLTAAETRVLNMLLGNFSRTIWDFSDPTDPKRKLSIITRPKKQPIIKVKRKNNRVDVTFRVAMEGDLTSVQTTVDYTLPENLKKLEKNVQKQIDEEATKLLHKTLHQWHTDCFHIHSRVKATFSTLQEWEAFKWNDHVKDTDYHVEISFQLRRFGDQVGPAIEGNHMQ